MVQDDIWFECEDGTRLFLRRWAPEAGAIAALHVVHGMAEHALRYRRLAAALCEAGVEVWAADQRGHGKTASLEVNAPGNGGLWGHCGDEGGFDRIAADILQINARIREERPGMSLFLMGHSWGSFVAQRYIERHAGSEGGAIDGCALSGTRGPSGLKLRIGAVLLAAIAALRGGRAASPTARALADGSYNRAFRPNRTPFDWLSRDEAEVDAYCGDPLCGGLCSAGFYRDLARGLCAIHRAKEMARVPKDLPVYVFCGSADPVGDMGASPEALVGAYRALGLRDVELATYPGARHELVNETCREEATAGLLAWVLARAARG